MITAKDIHRKKFEKVKLGYDPVDVNAFLQKVEESFTEMEQELTDSNDKLQILADKVREYKELEEDMKNALIGAQKQAREIIADANARAEEIEEEAKSKIKSQQEEALADQEKQLQDISEQLSKENAVLVATQHQVAAFKKSLFEMYKMHLEQISKIPDSTEDFEDEEDVEDEDMEVQEQAEETEEETTSTDSELEEPTAEEETPADSDSSADDLFAGESRRSKKNETDDMEARYGTMKFGNRRDEKKKRF